MKPSIGERHFRAEIRNQGCVTVAGNSVFFPSIGVNEDGEGVVAFSLSGPDFFRAPLARGTARARFALPRTLLANWGTFIGKVTVEH